MKEPYAPFSLNPKSVESEAAESARTPWSPTGLRRHFEILARISAHFRHKRIATFLRLFKPTLQTHVLDVGGLPRLWSETAVPAQLTILNLQPLPEHEARFLAPNQKFVQGDGTHLPWQDKSFDIVYSNSVIEHLGTWENQMAFAGECRRVGAGYWIQTPAREFPVEPHFVTLFLHWFSPAARKRLLRHFSLWGWLARPQPEAVAAAVAEVRLLTLKEFRRLFPDGQIIGSHLVAPKSPAYVRVGKLPAQILYVGTAPSLVNGALQINILLPKELIGGPAVPIQISVGNYTSPPGTTLAVK